MSPYFSRTSILVFIDFVEYDEALHVLPSVASASGWAFEYNGGYLQLTTPTLLAVATAIWISIGAALTWQQLAQVLSEGVQSVGLYILAIVPQSELKHILCNAGLFAYCPQYS